MKDRKSLIEHTRILLNSLGIPYKDISHYVLACTHKSLVNEKAHIAPKHNERLEFLWDAILQFSITKSLYKDFPDRPEWELTDIRSALVRGRNLANIAKGLKFHEHILLWKWEEMWWWRQSDYLLANTFEAFLWALYCDQWIDVTFAFIDSHIYSSLEYILENNLTKDFKTRIQEYTQAHFDITPSYKVLEDMGPDHEKSFLVGVFLGEEQIATGLGSSKKKAEEIAAKNGLAKLEISA